MQYLFDDEPLSNYLNRSRINLQREIESWKPAHVLNANEQECIDFLISKYTKDVPILEENVIHISEVKETEREDGRPTVLNASMLSGKISLTVSIPFKGERNLFKCRPSTHKTPPMGSIGKSEIRSHYEGRTRDSDLVKRRINKDLKEIKDYLQWIKQDLDSYNDWVKNNAKQFFVKRKKNLLRDQYFLESIGLPIKRAENLPETYSVPLERKKVEITRPKLKNGVGRPEPVLPEGEYEYILKTIFHMSLAMERNPTTFSKLTETEIRDFFVIILNSHYEGRATGETFNYRGRTDILIRVEDKNIFIAECKFWDGEKHFISTIDQILRYTNWRDTKAAIFLFSRKENFSNVLSKIEHTATSHEFFKRIYKLKKEALKNETIFSYMFQHPNDESRELYLTVLAFNIPK